MLFTTSNKSIVSEGSVDTVIGDELIASMIIKENLSEVELESFINDRNEVNHACAEGIVTEARTIVRLNKQAKFNRAYWAALFMIAREKNDRKYKKLETLWKMERQIEAYLEKRYGNEAKKRAKIMVKKLAKSKSSSIATAAVRAGKDDDKSK